MFKFKQFEIHDELSAMKIGTDGVLLGAWADVASDCRILDMGTGTGLIAIMAAQHNADARIVAYEIFCIGFLRMYLWVAFTSRDWIRRMPRMRKRLRRSARIC